MNVDIIRDYKNILNDIDNIIEVSGYKNEYLAKKLNISASAFSMKKKRKSFTIDEMDVLFQCISNEDVEDYDMLKIMESRQSDSEITSKDLYDLMGWK